MSKHKQLLDIIKKQLKPNEVIEQDISGRTVHSSSFGNEVVDGAAVATNHRVIVLKKPFIGKGKMDSFTYAQVGSVSINQDKDWVSVNTPGGNIEISGIDEDLEPDKFVKDINDRKQPKKASVDVDVKMVKPKGS